MAATRTGIIYPRIRTISSGRRNRAIDFDAAWRHLQQTTKAPDDCQRWNKKAARYDSRNAKNLYAEAFVELARVQPGETVFDMGCGTGTLPQKWPHAAIRSSWAISAAECSQSCARTWPFAASRSPRASTRSRRAVFSLAYELGRRLEPFGLREKRVGRRRIRVALHRGLPTCEARCANFLPLRDGAAASP